MAETALEMARRHVAEGERHIARQREILGELRNIGAPTDLAEQSLIAFEATQSRFLDDLIRFEGLDN